MLKLSPRSWILSTSLLAIALTSVRAPGQDFELRRTAVQPAAFAQLPPGLVVGDFDGSGMQDLATITDDCAALRVLMNPLSSAPTTRIFNPGVFCGGGYEEYLFDGGDVDGDGYDDLFLVLRDYYALHLNDIYLLRGSPMGLQMPGPPLLTEFTGIVAEVFAADMDGDGRKDLHLYLRDWWNFGHAQSFYFSDEVKRYRQTPSGQFLHEPTWSSGLALKSQSGDVQGDGREDAIGFRASVETLLISGQPQMYVFTLHEELQLSFIDAAGFLQELVFPHQLGTTDCMLRVGDFNSDGHSDAVIMSRATPLVQIFLGDPVQGLVAQSPMALPASLPTVRDLHIGDFDADLRTDLVVRASPTAGPSLFRGEGTGQLSTSSFALPSLATPLHSEVWEDFDGDGDADWGVLQLKYTAPSRVTFQVFENRALFGQSCGGSQGAPEIALGVASAGNPQFTIALQHAAPLALEQLFIATAARTIDDNLCGARFDSSALLLPPFSDWFTTSTDANGAAQHSFALPLGLAGQFVLQWAIVDPLGSFQTNSGIRIAATAARTIAIF